MESNQTQFENVSAKPLNELAESIEDLGYTVKIPNVVAQIQKKNF